MIVGLHTQRSQRMKLKMKNEVDLKFELHRKLFKAENDCITNINVLLCEAEIRYLRQLIELDSQRNLK